ncbi:MAG: 6-bladed beta-propeller [Acidobacteriota bacterium]|nr:6-bladed beta-propeller [Acidobacteriota bacterium]
MTTGDGVGGAFLLERARIGSDSEPGFVLGNPAAIAVDRERRVYVADMASMTVKVFDEAGGPLRRFGGRGRDPGKFLTIGPMALIGPGELAIVDDARGALSTWSTDGEFLGELTLPDDAHDIGQVEPWGPESLLLLYDSSERGRMRAEDKRGLLFHQTSRTSLATEFQFGTAELGFNHDPTPELHFESFRPPGSFARIGPGEIAYSPAFYEGNLYLFGQEDANGPWRFRGVLAGFQPSGRALEQLQPAGGVLKNLAATVYSDRGVQHFRAVHTSLGLFSTRAGSLVHFLRVRFEQGRDAILMQTFSSTGESLFCQQSNLLTKELLEGGLEHEVLAMDDRRQVYVVSRTPDWRVPTVRVFEVRPGNDD